MSEIHVLIGRGNNCSCSDCSVLYGGDCYTTPINNMLDKMEVDIEKYLSFTPTGRKKKLSGYAIDSVIEQIIKPVFTKYINNKKIDFYSKYYTFLPLVYLMTSNKKEFSKHYYMKARGMLFNSIETDYKKNE